MHRNTSPVINMSVRVTLMIPRDFCKNRPEQRVTQTGLEAGHKMLKLASNMGKVSLTYEGTSCSLA